jgi:H+-translocating NAD(P) transhydrogenase subunit alpha
MDVELFTWLVVVLILSGMIGYFVVWGVTPALHTPLMAVTNAISGIVVVAAMAVTGPAIFGMDVCTMLPCPYPSLVEPMQLAARVIGVLAVALCAVNIFGGFAITARMLAMYKPKEEPKEMKKG